MGWVKSHFRKGRYVPAHYRSGNRIPVRNSTSAGMDFLRIIARVLRIVLGMFVALLAIALGSGKISRRRRW